MRVLITGASSLPGYRTALIMLKRGHEVIGTCFSHEIPINHERMVKVKVDIRNREALETLFKEHEPDVVVHMAAYGDVDGCEKNKSLAWSVNVLGAVNIVNMTRKHSEYMLYLSTDYVFDGQRGMYNERDPPCPLNYYGLTKMCGEVAVLSSGVKSSIVRASSIYGFGPGRKNFAKFLMEKLRAGEKVRALVDQFTTPTQASLLAEAVAEIIERKLTGIFHIVGEKMSRYEFAIRVAEALGLDRSLIDEARMKDFSWLAPRPRDASLSCEFTKKVLKTDFYSIEKAMTTLKRELEEVLVAT